MSDIKIEQTKLTDLKAAPYNPRTINKKEFAGLVKSLEVFGFVDPIIANRATSHIVGGHMRYEAWKSLGHDTIPTVWVDLDDKAERKLNVVLNSQAISGRYDEVKLAEILEDFKADDDYEALRLDKLDPNHESRGPQEYIAECPECLKSVKGTVSEGELVLEHIE